MTTQFETKTHNTETQNVSTNSFVDILTSINHVLEIKTSACDSYSGNKVLLHDSIPSLSIYSASTPKHFITTYNIKRLTDAKNPQQRYLYGSLSLDSETLVIAD